MTLMYEMDTIDGVHEEVAKLYEKGEGGKYVLTGILGVSPKNKVDEFRNNNIELNNKLKAFEGIDPNTYKSMSTELAELKIRLEKSGMDEEQINKLVENRVLTMKTEFENESKTKDTTIKTQQEMINGYVINGDASAAAIKHLVEKDAEQDVLLRVKSVFKVENGVAVAYDKDGKKLYDATGTTPLSIDAYVKSLQMTAPHLFQKSVTSHITGRNTGFTGDSSKLSSISKIAAGLNNL